MRGLALIIIILLSYSCGKSGGKGYGCITKETAILTCRSYAGLKYQNPTMDDSFKRQCEAIYPADVCYQSLYHEDRI